MSTKSTKLFKHWTEELDARTGQGDAHSQDDWPDLTAAECKLYRAMHAIWLAIYKAFTAQGKDDRKGIKDAVESMVLICEGATLDPEPLAVSMTEPFDYLAELNWEVFHAIHVQVDVATLFISATNLIVQQCAKQGIETGSKGWLESKLKHANAEVDKMKVRHRKTCDKLLGQLRSSEVARSTLDAVLRKDGAFSQELKHFDSKRMQKRVVEVLTSLSHTVEALLLVLNDNGPP